MNYRVLFDLNESGFQSWSFALGVIPLFALSVALYKQETKRPVTWTRERLFTMGATVFTALWVFVSFYFPFTDFLFLKNAYNSGNAIVVVGTVREFDTREDGKNEEFTVNATPFYYSLYEATSAFHCPASKGGPVRSGLPVRITYVYGGSFSRNSIVKLETSKSGLQVTRCEAF